MTRSGIRSQVGLALLVVVGATACGGEEVKYKKRPAAKVKVSLPAVPNVPQTPIKAGDTYTVWGASYYLRSRVHRKKVAGQKISITGYITKTNYPTKEECYVHKPGKADPPDCVAPTPAFWIGDSKDAGDKDTIQVMGFASNFAQLWGAIEEYDKNEGKDDAEAVQDTFWAVPIPNPIPNKGAKVVITGKYSTTFTKASTGAAADPIMGIMTFETIKYLEAPPEKAVLPGMKLKNK